AQSILNQAAGRAELLGSTAPRNGWSIAQVAAAAGSQQPDLRLRAMAAWYLGRACNEWAQPRRVEVSIGEAKSGFETLGEQGWVAACNWQRNALYWTKTDFAKASTELAEALSGLQKAGFEEFLPHCRLAMANCQVLTEHYEEAGQNIAVSEAEFLARGDLLNQARCWMNEASRCRRQARLDAAFEHIDRALAVFEDLNVPPDIARASYQLGLLHLLRTDDLTKAVVHFERAAIVFASCDMELWRAACISNLGSIYMESGQLGKAQSCYEQAREVFLRNGVMGLLADNLNDSGRLNAWKGSPELSIEQYRQAQEIYGKLGSRLMVALEAANLGEAYGQLGRYQDALHHLELAAAQLEGLKHYLHLGSCERFTALIWLQLEQPALAEEHLEKATVCYEQSGQKALLASIYNLRAMASLGKGDSSAAILWLEKALQAAEKHGVRPQAALAHRLLGEALIEFEDTERGQAELKQAASEFREMGMLADQAASLIALGIFHLRRSEQDGARSAFHEALELSDGTMPEVEWQGRAGLAEMVSDPEARLAAYAVAITALSKIRHNFMQPTLAGSYLRRPAPMLEKAIRLAVELHSSDQGVEYIEAGKASTLLRQLSENATLGSRAESAELTELRSEIDWLQGRLRASLEEPNLIRTAVEMRGLRSQLVAKMKEYDLVMARLERQDATTRESSPDLVQFNLDVFRQLATRALGASWVALDYYEIGDLLGTAIITPQECELESQPISERARMALRASDHVSQGQSALLPGDLVALGDLLIPQRAADSLRPDTYLLIAPHRRLHGLPWPALAPSFLPKPLVCACTPAIIPSLHALCVLWQWKAQQTIPKGRDGLLVGISEFQG
ncbi:MAG: hypothetical protein ACXWNQ_10285, partial [Anaerolineales bacterium]